MAKTTITITDFEDSYVSGHPDSVNTNYGTADHVEVGPWISGVTYLTKSILRPLVNTDIIPKGKKTVGMRLKLTSQSSTLDNFYFVECLSDWSELTVTWNNFPKIKYLKQAFDSVPPGVANAEYSFDLFDVITLENITQHGIAMVVTSTSGNRSRFYSSETLTGTVPKLEIDVADAPLQPDNLSPTNGTAIDKAQTSTYRFSWSHRPSDVSQLPQKGYELQWSTDAYNWTTISGASANAYADVDVTAMPSGPIFWRVRTIDTDDVPSDWSEQRMIRIGTIPAAPNILNSVFDKASPRIEWTIAEQSGYQVQVLQGAELLIDTVVTTTDKHYDVPIVLDNETQFTVRVRCKNNSDTYSAWAEESISTEYTRPSIPTLSIVKKNILLN